MNPKDIMLTMSLLGTLVITSLPLAYISGAFAIIFSSGPNRVLIGMIVGGAVAVVYIGTGAYALLGDSYESVFPSNVPPKGFA